MEQSHAAKEMAVLREQQAGLQRELKARLTDIHKLQQQLDTRDLEFQQRSKQERSVLEQQVFELKCEIDRLRNLAHTKDEEIQENVRGMERTKTAMMKSAAEHALLDAEATELKEQNKSLEEKVDSLTREISRLNEDYDRERRVNEEHAAKIEELKLAVQNRSEEMLNLDTSRKQEIAQLQQAQKAAEEAVQAELRRSRNQLSVTEAIVEELREQSKQLAAKAETAKLDATSQQQQAAGWATDLSSLQQRNETLLREVTAVAAERDALGRRVEEVSQQLEESNAERERLQQSSMQASGIVGERDAYFREAERLRRQSAELEKAKTALEASVKQMDSKLQAAALKMNGLEDSLHHALEDVPPPGLTVDEISYVERQLGVVGQRVRHAAQHPELLAQASQAIHETAEYVRGCKQHLISLNSSRGGVPKGSVASFSLPQSPAVSVLSQRSGAAAPTPNQKPSWM